MKYFNLKFLLLFFALAVALPPAWAQNEVTVCDATTTTGYLPVYGYYFEQAQHNQMLYPQSELSELPEGCFITSITLYPTSALAFSGVDVTISLANLNSAAPFQVDGYGYSTALDVTVEPVATVTPAGQTILTIELEEPFQYDGGDLLIDVTTPDGGSYGSTTFTAKNVSDYYGFYSYGTTKKAIKYLPKLTLAYNVESKPYAAKVSPKSIDFGKVAPNSSHTENVTIKNTGGNAITPTLSGLDAPFSTTYTPATLAAGETATIPIEFNPTNAGTFNSTLHIGAVESEDIDLDVTLTGLAAYELTVCDETTENSYLPVYGLYVDEYAQNNQMIYPAEMLQGINGKAITSMTFYLKSGINFATDATFSLKNLAANTPEYESTPVAIEGYTAVKTVEVVKNSSLSEWTITFDQPFVYNGGDLLVNVETTVGSYGTTYFYGAGQTTYQSFYTSNRNGSKTRSKFLPKVTFGFEDSGETPVVNVDAPVFNPEDGTTFEENLTVTLTCATAGATIQYSYNGEYFTDYTEPITIDETTTIYAKAVLGTNESQVVQATYTKQAAPQPSTNEYVLVTDVADLAVGKHIIFVNKENAKAMSSTQNNNNRAATSITIDESNVATATEATEIFTLEQEQVEGVNYWLFKASKTPGYIYAAGANSNNYLKTEETADSKAQATIEIASDGKATVAFNAGSRNTMMYNSSNDIFACYASTSTQSPVYIFIEKSGDTPQPTPQVATPTFSVEAGEYTEAQNVTITCSTPEATIHYTVDGTEPTAESPVYGEAINVDKTMTIKAIAMKEGMTNSEIASATYTINIPSGETTTFVKVTDADQLVAGKKYIFVSGNYAMGVEPTGNFLSAISITGGDEVQVGDDVAIMTLDGTTGNYTLALGDNYLHAVNSTSLNFDSATKWIITKVTEDGGGFRAKHADYGRAVKKHNSMDRFGNYSTGDNNSTFAWIYVEKEEVTPEPEQVATPTFSVEAGEYTEAKSVEIACATEDATIHYTVDGTEPTAESPVYNEAINVDKTMTIKAIAVKEGWTNSEIATATYTINYPDIVVTLNPASGSFYLDEQAHVTVTTQNTVGDTMITYQIGNGEEMEYDSENGIVITASQESTISLTVTVADGYHEGVATVTGEYSFTARPVVTTPTFTPAAGEYTEVQYVNIACETEDATIHYTTDGTDPTAESPVYSSAITVADDMTIKAIAMKDGMVNSIIATAEYIIKLPVAAPTFSLANGTYNEPQTVTINAPEGATVYYSVDGGLTWNEGSTVNVDETTILMAKAVKKGIESPVVTAAYVINIPVTPNEVDPIKGYFSIKNNGNNMYANIQGRKTLNFTNDIDKQAGTVIWVETDNTGKVLSLRSQGADLQGYADRAMRYVPEIVELVVEKLHAEGSGEILGQTGLDAIMEKFKENFDHHLYVEKDENGYRIYGKTPSMQPVVDFYAENKSKVDAKLPMLQDFINDAIHKVIAKAGGHGTSILKDYDVHQTWERMGSNLTEPVDSASTMAFYQQVLCNKENVWSFAYESVMTYWERVKNHPRYEEIREELGEFAQYIDIIENVRPDFKYYIVQENNKPDYISQGNVNIINKEPSTYWTLEARNEFTVNIPEKRFGCPYQGGIGGYATTLYTDFAYTLPEGVKAYKVTNINENGRAIIEAINGIIPAQTPVLLAATEPGDKVFNLSTEAGTAVTDNLLVGPDYLIDKFNLTTPQVKKLFDYVKGVLGEDFYNSYIAEYEHLMLKNSGTVHNKYFWALPFDDVKKCIYLMEDGTEDCVVRNLDGDSFVNNGQVEANKAFLVTEKYQTIKIFTRGDANHDGKITIGDLSAIIDRLLKVEGAGCEYCSDVNEDDRVSIIDVSTLIDVLLGY